MARRKMSARTDQQVFKRTARTSRKVNIDPKNYRGGIRF